MIYTAEHQVADRAKRMGFAMQRRDGGYILTDGRGNGIVRAAFLDSQETQKTAFLSMLPTPH